ncbi:hypothetical protein CROQUDRAFT_420643 [Cronartium quercuum f. sp. fusiforme G11]|uniref:Uncharacterized protein n=1 Tax=Cronartium quercuum f. sp. fusiforme G11 TaxID=708437 RepID=A0A9P6TDC2_9BASI|nr:hypothetical protein CROQUDRAFT_420643 [Cronartium quercuum f. sp. fusiforme G11]
MAEYHGKTNTHNSTKRFAVLCLFVTLGGNVVGKPLLALGRPAAAKDAGDAISRLQEFDMSSMGLSRQRVLGDTRVVSRPWGSKKVLDPNHMVNLNNGISVIGAKIPKGNTRVVVTKSQNLKALNGKYFQEDRIDQNVEGKIKGKRLRPLGKLTHKEYEKYRTVPTNRKPRNRKHRNRKHIYPLPPDDDSYSL